MEIRTLEHTPIPQLTETFNDAFSDYVVPLSLTEDQLITKIHAESIDLGYSVGAFDRDRLVGFILHGHEEINGKRLLYNAGTGVIPEYRGGKLTATMYDYILPVLVKNRFSKITLEVIDSNQAAINVYQSIGFKTARTLNCYKGQLTTRSSHLTRSCESMNDIDWNLVKGFWEWEPSWQNSARAVRKSSGSRAILSYTDNQTTGYLIYNIETKRIQQFAVSKDHRNQGIGHALFEQFSRECGKQAILINVDANSDQTNLFLTGIGLDVFIRQFEMQLLLKARDK